MAEDKATVREVETDGPQLGDGNPGIGWGLAATLSFTVSTVLVAGYHFLLPPPAPRFGRVDLASVVAETQRGFAERVAKGETQAALDEATRAGQGLNRAVQRLARECACVILVADAVVAGTEDLTPRLRELLHAPD
ncbi:MAG TPA: TrbI F-type domain-containing protein [Thiobacillaceae bacterium]|nr:TrbI F-type domain-containing protein [Thiobacillaceae bacterium]